MDATTTELSTAQEFRDAMACIPMAVHVVATDGPSGRSGLTASAVASVTDTPPTLLVCVNHSSRSNAILKGNGVLTVNALRADQHTLAERFAGRAGGKDGDRFSEGGWTVLATGAPVLASGLCTFDCRIVEMVEVGTHTVMFAEVVAIRRGSPADGLVYKDRRYGVAPHQPE
ncbi:flavin reductase [Agaricicola taiwanensis]|nr:flavin reductase [Agaricicola taiwanensis]